MKYLKVTANWIVLILGFPFIFTLFLFGQPILDAVVEFGKSFKDAWSNLMYLFQRKDFIENRRSWLVDGLLWPLQKEDKKIRNARRLKRHLEQQALRNK